MHTLTEILEALPPAKARLAAELIQALPPEVLTKLRYHWPTQARPAQMKPVAHPWSDRPADTWLTWLILAGRGFGKTRAGAEYVRGEVEQAQKRGKPIRIALVAPTAADARDVMIEGDSGLLNVCPPGNVPKYESSKRRVTWKDGSQATHFSAEEAERLRGPQHHIFWADELAAWTDVQGTWDMLMFGMRLVRPGGLGPQGCVTTTPKPVPTLVKIARSASTIITKGSTFDNRANLASTFFDNVISAYEGTRLGRQEVEGELLLDVQGALWAGPLIEQHRVAPDKVPPLVRIVVAVDPSVSDKEQAECGIIAAGIDARGHVYVLEDASLQGPPVDWARRAVACYQRLSADKIVAEVNNGGALVREVLMTAAPGLFSFKPVHASRGKLTRAEPVSALYERGRVHHVGSFKKLEDQMVSYSAAQAGKLLVDRMDALVWAVTELAVRELGRAESRGMFH